MKQKKKTIKKKKRFVFPRHFLSETIGINFWSYIGLDIFKTLDKVVCHINSIDNTLVIEGSNSLLSRQNMWLHRHAAVSDGVTSVL